MKKLITKTKKESKSSVCAAAAVILGVCNSTMDDSPLQYCVVIAAAIMTFCTVFFYIKELKNNKS
ncbi:hypothetical protein [Dysgonomonas sp. 25]|uniref:hypothetical protein n=1 Tax=Dysgonomonas sp. 25 TaxID=2302933 RepID=UPI0013D1F794|nr:hypothetical protein [Dysgonomonas sp. 25]NDV68729.1 hypothetical protein [Dysgonomonas sp. 25]